MQREAIQIIRDEHLAIATVLYTLGYLVRQRSDDGPAPDFPVLHAILDYIVSYPDCWHHPKEDDCLFKTVQQRTHDADELIAQLKTEHQKGYVMIDTLRRQLARAERGDVYVLNEFLDTAERYAQFEWAHIRKEEDVLLPLAQEVLTSEDWEDILCAFRESDNPSFGIKPRDQAELLYQRILELAPAPIGYGKGA